MKLFNRIFEFCIQPKLLYFYFLIAMIVPNVALCFTEHLPFWASATNIILPLSVYAYLFSVKRKPGWMIWVLFPFVFLAAFQMVLLYLFGNSIIAVDMFLNLVTTNPTEAMELLNNLVPAVLGVFILYLPALILGIISIRKKNSLTEVFCQKVRRWSGIGTVAGFVLLGITYLVDKEYDVKIHLYPANVCYNCYLAFERTQDTSHYYESSKDFHYDAKATHDAEQPEVYIFVVGETGRACNWGLYGYERNTTPLLQQQPGVVAFDNALTQSNTTHKSVPMLLSLASAENYHRIYQEKGIITAFKEAGFYTAFFSNQQYNRSFIDFFGKEADTWRFLKEEGGLGSKIHDNQLLELVDELLAENHKKLFIVLHTYGSHFNYEERYGKEVRTFTPDHITDVSPKYRPVLINAYDNTILQTDLFLNSIIERLQHQGIASAMLYTSDHGEDIFDDSRKLFLHASPIPSYYQLHVPFIIWMSDHYATLYPDIREHVAGNRKKAVATNACAIHTLLEMAGLQTPYRMDTLSVANERYVSERHHYINDHNLPKAYDKIGLKKKDIEQLQKHHITFP